MTQSDVWTLPHLSQEFDSPPYIGVSKDRVTVRYDFETDSGDYEFEELIFEDAVAVRFTSSVDCTVDQIDAYDTLVEVTDSPWLEQRDAGDVALHHFRIFFDDTGAIDVLAARFLPPG